MYPAGELRCPTTALVILGTTILWSIFKVCYIQNSLFVCLCWGFMAQSTQWGHVDRSQFT